MHARTLFDKIWDAHVIADLPDGDSLVYIDLHLLNEVTSPQAFETLRQDGHGVRRPERAIAVADHNITTGDRAAPLEPDSREQLDALERNVAEAGIPYIPLRDPRQGILHIVAPELGLVRPGMTVVCGDSHTSTHGALGAFAFGIGTSEVAHVLATQTLVQKRPANMRVMIDGTLPTGATAKDLALHVMRELGTSGGAGHVIEYGGDAVLALGMAGRMTLCNMSIEAGARAGLVAPDATTFEFLKGRLDVPVGAAFDRWCAHWRSLASDPGAVFGRTVTIDARAVPQLVTWGTTPATALRLDDPLPSPDAEPDPGRREQLTQMLHYMGLRSGQVLAGMPIDVAFIGSCTNARIEDLRDAAAIVRGRHVANGVRALVVPGSGSVKATAEAEGLDAVFTAAGFEWRESGCSMCLGMNADRLAPGERCASSSNRNFEGRQGPGGRTHLMSPAMVAAAAVAGRLASPQDVR